MAAIWLAARLAALGAPYAVYALLDALLLPWVAGVLLGCSGSRGTAAISRWVPWSCCWRPPTSRFMRRRWDG